jgi:hypothetical protein
MNADCIESLKDDLKNLEEEVEENEIKEFEEKHSLYIIRKE